MLAEALRETVTNISMRKQAADLGRRLQMEEGTGRTVELFSWYAEQFRRKA